jgi:hypothetical protein
MPHRRPDRFTPGARRARRRRVAGLLAAAAVIAAVLVAARPEASPSRSPADPPADSLQREERGAPPAPGVADLDRDLRRALRRAAADAARDGVAITVVSGSRSPEHQAELLEEAIATYGSYAEAARWVATPETSAHVSGDAVDVDAAAADWLAARGAAYGLCRVYDNEPWHFELRPDAAAGGCPATYPDPTYDPRLHP